MLDAILFLIILSLTIALITAHDQIETLQRRLLEADLLLAIQQDLLRHWQRMATGGAFAQFINSLDLSRLGGNRKQDSR